MAESSPIGQSVSSYQSAGNSNDPKMASAGTENAPISVNVVVLGRESTGKSTIIKTLCGIPREVSLRMFEKQGFQNTFNLIDTPAIESSSFPLTTFLKDVPFKQAHFFIIMSAGRFMETEARIGDELKKKEKQFVYVRAFVDRDIHNAKEDSGLGEEDVKSSILGDIKQNLESGNLKDVCMGEYVVNSRDRNGHDMEKLVGKLREQVALITPAVNEGCCDYWCCRWCRQNCQPCSPCCRP